MVITATEAHARIGDLLLKHTSLTPEQLEECVALQQEEGGRLGDILLRKKYVLPHEITRALCFQIDLPYIEDLRPAEIDPKIVDKLPINYARSREVLPVSIANNVVTVAVSDPFNLESIEDLRILYNCSNIRTVVTTSNKLQDALNRVYERNTSNMIQDIKREDEESYDDLEGPIDILDATEDEAPVIRFVNSVIFRAVKEKASDIHVEPFEKETVIRFRVDGIMHDILHQPKKVHAAVSSRIKVMGNLDIAEKRIPQDGRIFRKVAGKEIDIRLSTIPTQFGERMVMRILEKGGELLSLERLGFEGETLEQVNKLIQRENGIILVTGPTGSGKSTTMAACLARINSPDLNILTAEDPVEYQIPGAGQLQVNPKIELTFAKALRAFLRQDPDVIMVGEVRDSETAELAVTAALTGHLVISSLHTNEAAGAFPRLIDMGVEPFLVASSVNAVMAQRLMRRVCLKCRESYEATALDLQELGVKNVKGPITLYKAVGCVACSHSGYSGRINIHELLIMDDNVRSLVMKNSDAGSIRRAAQEKGMLTMREDGARKVLSGVTTVQELSRTLHADELT